MATPKTETVVIRGVRDEGSPSGSRTAAVRLGNKIEILGEDGKWYPVKADEGGRRIIQQALGLLTVGNLPG